MDSAPGRPRAPMETDSEMHLVLMPTAHGSRSRFDLHVLLRKKYILYGWSCRRSGSSRGSGQSTWKGLTIVEAIKNIVIHEIPDINHSINVDRNLGRC